MLDFRKNVLVKISSGLNLTPQNHRIFCKYTDCCFNFQKIMKNYLCLIFRNNIERAGNKVIEFASITGISSFKIP